MKLDAEVFAQPQFGPAVEANYVPVKINADEAQQMARAYGVTSLPVDVIITPAGKLVTILASPPTMEKYLTQLNEAALGYRQLNGGGYAQVPPGSPTSSPVGAGAGYQPPVGPPPVAQAASGDRYADYNNPAMTNPSAGGAGGYPARPDAPQGYPAQQVAAAGYPAQPAAATTYPAQPPANPGYPAQAPANTAQPPGTGPYNQFAQQPPAGTNGQPLGNQSFGPGAAAAPYGQQPPVVPASSPYGQPGPPPVQPPVQLPPGSPPLGLEGYCPVTLINKKAWVLGNKRYGAIHRDRTYLFAGAEEQQKFLANPDAFSPVISGNDPVLALDQRQTVPGTRQYGVFLGNRIYLFSSEASRTQFERNPKRYAAEILQAMR